MLLGHFFFSLKFQSVFGVSVILTACHLINRTPSPVISWQTPFFQLYNKHVDYTRLRVFYSLCFASTLVSNRSKFHPRVVPSVFVGYPQGRKGFKLYDIEHKHFWCLGIWFFINTYSHFIMLLFRMMSLIHFQILYC